MTELLLFLEISGDFRGLTAGPSLRLPHPSFGRMGPQGAPLGMTKLRNREKEQLKGALFAGCGHGDAVSIGGGSKRLGWDIGSRGLFGGVAFGAALLVDFIRGDEEE